MTKDKIAVGIDVGTSKIVTIIGKVAADLPINVAGVAEVKAAGMRKGQIVDIDEAMSSINASLEAAERMAGVSVSGGYVSIGGAHIESQNSRGVVAVSDPDREITREDVRRVIEAARAISLSSSREILHVVPRGFAVDGEDGIKDPVGMTGVRLEVDTHIVTANSTSVRNIVKAASEVGVDVWGVVFGGFASSLAVLSDTEKELGVVMVDIGAGTTDICIFIEGALSYSAVLPIGARHITNDLAIGLRVSLESAEKIKLFLSQKPKRVILPPEEEKKAGEKPDEIDLKELHLQEEVKKVSQKTLIEGIIKPRLNEIFTMIGLEIKRSGFGGQTPAGVVVTGGGAETVSLSEAAKRMLSMPVRIGQPTNMTGLIDEIESPAASTAIGLLHFAKKEGIKSTFGGFGLPSLPVSLPLKKLGGRAFDLIKSFLP
ncbi:cell division protein FtsA [Candidatus Microgenomates bacterium]|nr:cell division protein FtsA [Candidatus Microgenomates bacterium]